MLRNSENGTLRIFLDRNIRGVTKCKGKGRGKGKGKGKGKAKERRLRRAREARVPETGAKAASVPRVVKVLRPPPAPPPPPLPPRRPSERSNYGPLQRRVFKRLAEYHRQLVCLDLTVSLSSFVHCLIFGESTSLRPNFPSLSSPRPGSEPIHKQRKTSQRSLSR